MDARPSWLPIESSQLAPYMRKANGFLAKVEWRPRSSVKEQQTRQEPAYRASSTGSDALQSVSLLALARKISRDEALLTQDMNHCLQVLRKALQLGMHLSTVYGEASGLDRLAEQNRRGGLTEHQRVEFREKYNTSAAITLFVVSYFVTFELATYKLEELGAISIDFAGIPEVSLQNPVRAMQCMLFYYGGALDSAVVNSDLEALKLTQLYFQAVLDEIKLREASLNHTEVFDLQAYRLVETDFFLHGFEVEPRQAETSVNFNRVELTQIVGNQDAKHSARRLVERLLCYDVESQRNPFTELGGFPRLRLGYGKPGTGKSLQIAATATLLHDYCQDLGIPFLFWPMPDTIVSTFQGGSAERMVNWMKPLQDPTKIIYAPIDDGENNLEDRGRQGVSAGVREVIGVFLRYTEGAYALNYGNSAIDIFTNIPDQIDKAVLSRIVDRFAIDGATRQEDFLDQDYLWWRRYQDIDEGFISMKNPADYHFLAAQAELSSLAEVYDQLRTPTEDHVRSIFEAVQRDYAADEHQFFAEFYRQVQANYPFFTSRDVRNIQQAVNNRIMDFDLPAAWFDDHALFFKQTYDTKKAMLVELMKSNMQGLSFAELRLQEVIRYLDTMVQIASVTREQRLEEMLQDAILREEVLKRLESRG